jgi:ketosteroid isomerase-like protein
MVSSDQNDPAASFRRLSDAMNRHDIDAFVACFAPDYHSEQPTHPDRKFVGSAQVRENWSGIFAGMPDFHAEIIRLTVQDDTVWVEWHWQGTRADGTATEFRGVCLFGVQNNLIAWGRLYMETIEQGGAGIVAAVKGMTGEE